MRPVGDGPVAVLAALRWVRDGGWIRKYTSAALCLCLCLCLWVCLCLCLPAAPCLSGSVGLSASLQLPASGSVWLCLFSSLPVDLFWVCLPCLWVCPVCNADQSTADGPFRSPYSHTVPCWGDWRSAHRSGQPLYPEGWEAAALTDQLQ